MKRPRPLISSCALPTPCALSLKQVSGSLFDSLPSPRTPYHALAVRRIMPYGPRLPLQHGRSSCHPREARCMQQWHKDRLLRGRPTSFSSQPSLADSVYSSVSCSCNTCRACQNGGKCCTINRPYDSSCNQATPYVNFDTCSTGSSSGGSGSGSGTGTTAPSTGGSTTIPRCTGLQRLYKAFGYRSNCQ